MTSKVINMVDRMKDEEDLALEALFASEPIADDGFSERVVARINRRAWTRRLVLPLAAAAGLAIAAKPALELLRALAIVMPQFPAESTSTTGLQNLAIGLLPDMSVWTLLTIAAVAMMCLLPALDESA